MRKNNYTKTYEWLKQYEDSEISILHMSNELSVDICFKAYDVTIDRYTTVEITNRANSKNVYRMVAGDSEDNSIIFITDKKEMENMEFDAQVSTKTSIALFLVNK